MKFKVHDFVEQVNLGDLPFIVASVETGPVNRYDLSCIDGHMHYNVPEYMMRKARPAHKSRYGAKSDV